MMTGAAGVAGLRPGRATAEPPPETTTVKLLQFPSGCQGPLYVAEELLHEATAICAQQPERTARLLVERGVVKNYDYALQTVRELPYARWRDYDSEDTLRFYALRLHEAGMIKSSPRKIIAQGCELRFVNELKKELKT